MSDRDRGDDSYTGRAGQQAFIAQVLLRFGNAAVPVVDVGTDVIVFADDLNLSVRVQVKTGKIVRDMKTNGYDSQFNLPLDQLDAEDDPPLFYALVTRDEEANTFPDCLLISRVDVQGYRNGTHLFGYLDTKHRALKLKLRFHPRVILGVACREVELTGHRNAWHALPPLAPPPIQAAESSAGGE